MVHPQDLAEPLDAFWGEFSWLAGIHLFNANAVLVLLILLFGRSISAACLALTPCSILIDYMTSVIEINQILSRRT
jgi:hypothetical protein